MVSSTNGAGRNGAAPARTRIGQMLAVAAAFAAVVTPSAGYSKSMREKMQTACAADIAQFCPDQAKEEDRLKPCMLQHRTKVSAACMHFVDSSE